MFQSLWRELDLIQRDQLQAVLRAHIHASAAEHATRSVLLIALKHGVDPTTQAAPRLAYRALFVKTDLHFGNARSPFQRKHGDRLAGNLHIVAKHAMVAGHFDFDLWLGVFPALQILVDAYGDALSVANRVDDQSRSEYA